MTSVGGELLALDVRYQICIKFLWWDKKVSNLMWEEGVVVGGEMIAWEGNKMEVGKDWYREKTYCCCCCCWP